MKKIRYSFFPQTQAIDQAIAQRILDEKGFKSVKLMHPILYRGDTRDPWDICKNGGFTRRIEYLAPPQITPRRGSKNCIATSVDLVHAVGFADNPEGHLYQDNGFKSRFYSSWVYFLYAPNGIELYKEILPNGTQNKAALVKEVALTRVPGENIIAAFEIRPTENDRVVYYKKDIANFLNPEKIQWQIPITEHYINENCSLQETHPDLYKQTINEFMFYVNKGYFRIPWSPYPEDIGFGLNSLQKQAITDLGLSREEAKMIRNTSQVESLKRGYDKSFVLFSDFFGIRHLNSLKKGASMEEVKAATYIELEGMSKGLTYAQVQFLTEEYQIRGLKLGFSKKDVLASWFTIEHMNAAFEGVPVSILREKPENDLIKIVEEFEARSLSKVF